MTDAKKCSRCKCIKSINCFAKGKRILKTCSTCRVTRKKSVDEQIPLNINSLSLTDALKLQLQLQQHINNLINKQQQIINDKPTKPTIKVNKPKPTIKVNKPKPTIKVNKPKPSIKVNNFIVGKSYNYNNKEYVLYRMFNVGKDTLATFDHDKIRIDCIIKPDGNRFKAIEEYPDHTSPTLYSDVLYDPNIKIPVIIVEKPKETELKKKDEPELSDFMKGMVELEKQEQERNDIINKFESNNKQESIFDDKPFEPICVDGYWM